MGRKKKTPPPKVYNTRASSKEEAAVTKEQVASWWDKLVSGESERKSEKHSGKDENKSDAVVRVPEKCELSRSVSTVPSVSTVRFGSDNSEEVIGSEFESSGSSYTVAGDESVNSSPSIMKVQDVKSTKMASVYDILDYEKKNFTIPVKHDLSGSLTPVKESLAGKSEFEIWMLRRDASLAAAKVKTGVEISPEIMKEFSPVSVSASEMKKNDGACNDDVSTEHSLAAAEDVKSVNPKNSKPSDEGNDQRSQMEATGVGPVGELDSTNGLVSPVDGMGPAVEMEKTTSGPNSPSNNSPCMCKSNDFNASPSETNKSPSQKATMPSAVAAGSDQKSDNVVGPADQAKAQKKVSFADILMGQNQEKTYHHTYKFGQFEKVIEFKEDIQEIDPLRGTKYWNHELFQKLLRGDDVVDGETRLAYVGPSRNAEGVFEVNIEGHFMKKSHLSNVFQLYGNFVGTIMPFQVVKENLIKMWHKYGLKAINMNRNGYFFFKFDHEEGMSQVLERSPWLVDNVPLVLQVWDPSVVLCKPNPKSVPIWVTIKDLPLSLWNGGNIGQVVSCVGKPLMLDQATFKRCETKEGPLSFARVLVDAKASSGLPDKVKINLPKCGEIPGKSYFLNFSYKWKPPCCKKCEVFGHLDEKCPYSVQPVLKDQIMVKNGMGTKGVKAQVDEFIEVVRKPRAQNKGKTPIWQPKKTKVGPSISEPGPSQQMGLNDLGPNAITGHNRSEMGLVNEGHAESPKLKVGGPDIGAGMGLGKTGLTKTQPLMTDGLQHESVGLSAISSPRHDAATSNLKHDGPILEVVTGSNVKSKGSGFFDVSKQDFGHGPSQNVHTKNSFGSLRDEEECYDTELGLWENEIEVVKKFVESNTRPKIVDYDSWSGNMKKNYDELTKMNEDEEVASETDEMARFMKSDVKS